MAKKKPSGYQRLRFEPVRRAMANSPCFSNLVRKRGRPKLVTDELQAQLYRDLAWLGWPYKPDLYSYLAKKLPDKNWRAKNLPSPDKDKDWPGWSYKISQRALRREIANAHRRIWGGKIRI